MFFSLFFITPINICPFLIARRFRFCEDSVTRSLSVFFFFPADILSLQLLKLASIYTLLPETVFDESLSADVVCFNCLIFQLMDRNLKGCTVFQAKGGRNSAHRVTEVSLGKD